MTTELPKSKLTAEMHKRIMQDDQDAWDMVYRQYEGLIHGIVRNYDLTHSQYEFEDILAIANEAFVRAVKKFDPSKGVEFSTLLVPAVRRFIYNWTIRIILLNKNDGVTVSLQEVVSKNAKSDPILRQDVIPDIFDLQLTAESHEVRQIVDGTVQKNKPRAKTVIALRINGHSREEVAKIVGLTPTRVSQIYKRFRAELADNLAQHGYIEQVS